MHIIHAPRTPLRMDDIVAHVRPGERLHSHAYDIVPYGTLYFIEDDDWPDFQEALEESIHVDALEV